MATRADGRRYCREPAAASDRRLQLLKLQLPVALLPHKQSNSTLAGHLNFDHGIVSFRYLQSLQADASACCPSGFCHGEYSAGV